MERGGDLTAWGRRLACRDALQPADVYWRAYGAVISVLALALLVVNLTIVVRHHLARVNDWEEVLFVGVPPLFAAAVFVSALTVTTWPGERGVWVSAARGSMVGGSIQLHFLIWMLAPSAQRRLDDGLQYVFSVFFPIFWIGLPLYLVGAVIGAKRGGARLPMPLVVVLAVLLLAPPLWFASLYILPLLSELAREAFIFIFAAM